jgi:hypothetical protein
MEWRATPRLGIFLDDGGVMNDNCRRSSQWQRRAGTFFAPRLGGEPAAWARANRVVTATLFDPQAWQDRLGAAPDYAGSEHLQPNVVALADHGQQEMLAARSLLARSSRLVARQFQDLFQAVGQAHLTIYVARTGSEQALYGIVRCAMIDASAGECKRRDAFPLTQ